VDVVLDLAAVGEEGIDRDARDRLRVRAAEQDAAGVELVAAQFGHQAFTGPLTDPPADQLFHALVTVPAEVDVLILGGNFGEPGVVVALLGAGTATLGLVTMPERADVADVADDVPLGGDFQRVGVEVAVVPLVADRQHLAGLPGDAGHSLAVADGL